MPPCGLLVIMRHCLFGISCIQQWCQLWGVLGTHQKQCLRHPINHQFFHWEIWIMCLIFLVPEIIFIKVMCVNQLAVCLAAMARLIMGCIDPMCIMNLFHMHHLFRLKILTWFKIQILIAHRQIQFLKISSINVICWC